MRTIPMIEKSLKLSVGKWRKGITVVSLVGGLGTLVEYGANVAYPSTTALEFPEWPAL
jgi:hypothetical protein